MTERQKQHQGRSKGDDTTLEGRDVRAGAVAGTGHERVAGAFEEGAKSSDDALHIEALLDKATKANTGDASAI